MPELLLDWPGLSDHQRAQLNRFYELVLDENSRQNLTRIAEPTHFFEEHFGDVRKLAEMESLTGKILDLGTGGGLPGLPLAIVRADLSLVLCDSEKKKAEFLQVAVQALELPNVTVTSERGERVLFFDAIPIVLTRAVGPISRIWTWIGECSTWNTLVLLKGPAWEEEWDSYESKKARSALEVKEVISYEVGAEIRKQRKIVVLKKTTR